MVKFLILINYNDYMKIYKINKLLCTTSTNTSYISNHIINYLVSIRQKKNQTTNIYYNLLAY